MSIAWADTVTGFRVGISEEVFSTSVSYVKFKDNSMIQRVNSAREFSA